MMVLQARINWQLADNVRIAPSTPPRTSGKCNASIGLQQPQHLVRREKNKVSFAIFIVLLVLVVIRYKFQISSVSRVAHASLIRPMRSRW